MRSINDLLLVTSLLHETDKHFITEAEYLRDRRNLDIILLNWNAPVVRCYLIIPGTKIKKLWFNVPPIDMLSLKV